MPNRGRHHFGNVRTLASGRYQARYWHAGAFQNGPTTYDQGGRHGLVGSVETEIHRGAWVDPVGGRLTVAELADRWLAHDPSKRSSTLARDEAILRLHVMPALGSARVGQVTPVDIQKLVNVWTAGRGPRTARRQYDVVRALFAYAVSSDWLARSPCRGIDLPRVTEVGRQLLAPKMLLGSPSQSAPVIARWSGLGLCSVCVGERWPV